MSLVNHIHGSSYSYPIDKQYDTNSFTELQPLTTGGNFNTVDSVASRVLFTGSAYVGKRPVPLSAEQSDPKRKREGIYSDSVTEQSRSLDANWTLEQLGALLREVERRKLTPWDPVGVNEMSARIGYPNKMECSNLFNQMLADEEFYHSVKMRLSRPVDVESVSEDSSDSSESEPMPVELDSWTSEQLQVILNEIDRRKVNSWDPVGFDEITRKVGGGHSRGECLAMYNRIAMDESLYSQLKNFGAPSLELRQDLPDDPSFDYYLSTGKLFSDSVLETSDGSKSLFNS